MRFTGQQCATPPCLANLRSAAAKVNASPWWPLLTKRAQSIITYELAMNTSLTSIETSQSPGRCHTRSDHVVGTVIPKGRIWLPKLNRWLTGKESLMIHGLHAYIHRACEDVSMAWVASSCG